MKNNWKKSALLAGCSLFLFSACSGANAQIQNEQEVLFTIGDQSISRGDEYELIKKANGPTMTVTLIQQAIMDEEIGRGEEIQKEANEHYESTANGNEKYEDSLKEAGYKDKQDYIDKVIIPTLQQDKLIDKYFKDNAKAIEKEYKPSIAKVLMCDNKDDAENALKALKDGTDPQTVFDQYASKDATYGNEEIVVSTLLKDSIPTYVINTLYSEKETGVIDEVMTDDEESSGAYYVGILVSNDYDKNLDTIKEDLSSKDSENIAKDCSVYYMKKHHFEIHDQYVFDSLRSSDPEYLVNHPELVNEEDQ